MRRPFKNLRIAKRALVLLLALAAAMLAAVSATAQEGLARLSSQGYSRDFGGRAVNTSITIAGGGSLSPGGKLTLQIDLGTNVEAGDGPHAARGTALNGLLQVALPPGLEPDGKLRLSYFDTAKGSYQFMYSRDYPKLDRLSGMEEAFAAAGGNNPEQIFDGLSRISGALDPALSSTAPSDPRINGGDAQYAVTGITWLVPCNVMHKPVVDPFDPEASIEDNAKLRATIPLKCTGAVSLPVAVYVGGLSVAVVETELPADKLPASAIPLVPLPELPAPAAAPAEGAAAADGANPSEPERKPASDGAGKPPPPSGARAAGADAGTAAAQPPPIIPVLTYSYDWIAWETEITAEALSLGAAGQSKNPDSMPARNPGGNLDTNTLLDTPQVEPAESSGTDLPPRPNGDSVDIPANPGSSVKLNRNKPAPREEAAEADSGDSAGAEEQESTASGDPEQEASGGSREVKLGTLPDEPEVYRVPLKQITDRSGSGGGDGRSFDSGNSDGADNGFLPDNGSPFGGKFGGGSDNGGSQPRKAPADLTEMVLIPAGEFLMGTGGNASAGDADELPQEKVFLPDYYIDKYPVTNRQFYDFVLSAGYKAEGGWQKYFSQVNADEPVRGVTWNDAMAYAKWAHKRLPTEAEWEKAARGEDGRTYPWGEDWSSDLLPREENLTRVMTAPGTGSPYGVMGMVGVVWQWTASAYSSSYPFNPAATNDKRVLRGGAYSNGRNIVRCANRYAEAPNVPLNTFGFRCAKDAK